MGELIDLTFALLASRPVEHPPLHEPARILLFHGVRYVPSAPAPPPDDRRRRLDGPKKPGRG